MRQSSGRTLRHGSIGSADEGIRITRSNHPTGTIHDALPILVTAAQRTNDFHGEWRRRDLVSRRQQR